MLKFDLKKKVLLGFILVLQRHIHKTGIIYLITTSGRDMGFSYGCCWTL